MGFILGGDPQPAGHRLAGWLLADFRQNQAAGKVSHFQEPGAQMRRSCRSYFNEPPIFFLKIWAKYNLHIYHIPTLLPLSGWRAPCYSAPVVMICLSLSSE